MTYSETELARTKRFDSVKDKMLKRLWKLKSGEADRQVVGYVRDTSEDLLDLEDFPDEAFRF